MTATEAWRIIGGLAGSTSANGGGTCLDDDDSDGRGMVGAAECILCSDGACGRPEVIGFAGWELVTSGN